MTVAGDKYRAAIARALSNHGRYMTLRQIMTQTYDPATGVAPDTDTDVTVFGIVTAYKDREIDGTRIEQGDRRVVLQGSGLEAVPVEGDRIIDGTDNYTVMNIKKYDIDGSPFAWVLQGRKS